MKPTGYLENALTQMSNDYLGNSIASICSSGQRPLLMTGAFVQWLRQHFIDANNIEDPDLALENTSFNWSHDLASTNIIIESYTRFNPLQIEHRPALIVKRNKLQHVRLGIDNRYMGTSGTSNSREYSNAWAGSHTIFVLSGEGAECEKLTAEVYRELNQFAPVMRQALNLAKIELSEIGDMHVLEEATDNFVVPITVAYSFFESWTVTPVAPPMRAVMIK